MTGEARTVIRAGYLLGEPVEKIAAAAGVTVHDTETYLRWWCDRGCPGVDVEQWESAVLVCGPALCPRCSGQSPNVCLCLTACGHPDCASGEQG